jgi:hypothetical protein
MNIFFHKYVLEKAKRTEQYQILIRTSLEYLRKRYLRTNKDNPVKIKGKF